MRKTKKICTIAVAMVAATANVAVAAPKCANSDEVTAIQAAAIQQQLMVAALTCNQIDHFNAFQTTYSKELRRSDASLAHMFHRLYGGHGESEYHAFKTRLANDSSMNRMLSPMYWMGVLISCAIPAASCPTDSSFWA